MSEQVEGGDGVTTSFDLLSRLEEGSIPLGFIAVVKYLDDEGVPSVIGLAEGVYPWETPGLMQYALNVANEVAGGGISYALDEEEEGFDG